MKCIQSYSVQEGVWMQFFVLKMLKYLEIRAKNANFVPTYSNKTTI